MTDYKHFTREELEERLRAAESRLDGSSQFSSRRASEEKYRALFENMVEEVHFWKVIRDATGAIVNWRLIDINPAAERSWGRKRAEVVGKAADEIFPTATTVFMPIVRKIFSESAPYQWETYFEDLKQHMKMSSVSFGEYFFTTGFDITEIKESQLKKEKLGVMARLATEASGIGVWELDIDTGRLIWNDRMLEIFGVDRDSLTGTARDWSERLHPDEAPALIAKLKSCIEESQGFNGKFRIVTPDGITKILKASSDFIKTDMAKSKTMIGTNIDITDQENAIAALAGARDIAERSSKAKSQFLASMSHELRTPLNAILGFSEVIQSRMFGDDTGRYAGYAGDIRKSAEHLLSLVNDMLDMAAIEAGRTKLTFERLSLGDILAETVRLTERLAQARGVIQRVEIAPDATIIGDRRAVRQMVTNLLTNAIKYGPASAPVVVAAECTADMARLHIDDSGRGVPADVLARIDTPFGKDGDPWVRSDGGVGLGLSIASALARLHGGTIAFGRGPLGHRVTISFPQRGLGAHADAGPGHAEPPPPGGGARSA